jgi:hypothetical protein
MGGYFSVDPRVDFESAWAKRTDMRIDTESGGRASVISRSNLTPEAT